MSRNVRQKNQRRGHLAEIWAAWILRIKGYRILKRRAKTPVGEVDLIAKKRDMLVFVEVKLRKNLDEGMYSIPQASQNRICRAANFIMANSSSISGGLKGNKSLNPDSQAMRFDAMIISGWSFRHIQNAWSCSF